MVDDPLVIVIVTLVLVLIGLLLWTILRGREGSLSLIQEELHNLSKEMRQSLDGSAQRIDQRLENAFKTVGEVQVNIGRLEESNKRIFEVGKDISSLQEILRAPKLRGGLGEFLLGDLLAQIMPAENFVLQHSFKSGERVDAVIKLGSGLIPVDAKFPLENFRKGIEATIEEERESSLKTFVSDVKKHIDTIAKKYILPDEGTFDFALMYIPAENVYYETIIKSEKGGGESISSYALTKRVIPVSPNSFYAYLQTILLGLRGMRIEKNARRVMDALSRLRWDFGKLAEDFDKVGSHLDHARSSFDSAQRRIGRFTDKLEQIESPAELPSKDDGG